MRTVVGGLAERAATAAELAQGDLGLALSFTFQAAFLDPLLGNAGVAQVFGGNGCDLHEVLASE